MLDPISVCTLSLKNNPGSYAVFLGSGVSFSSRIPTGWDVIIDLISQIAILEDQKTDDPYKWYKIRYNKEPNYSDLLSQVATTPLGRQNLLQKYFEPTDEEIKLGIKTPTKAHKSIASLVKRGFIKIIITTNFDRLIEKALHEVNIDPIVVKSSDDVESVPPLAHLKNPLIIKLNGDYLDLRFKNTIEELSAYDSRLCSLVKDVFSNYGLIVSGWSAKWDLEIVNMLKTTCCGFETFWSEPFTLSENASELLESRKGLLVKKSSDDFFPLLEVQLTKLIPEKKEPVESAKEDTLPFFLTNFIDRPEKQKLRELIETSRMITVTGPGGGGKTRLAVEVVKVIKNKYPVHFIDLSNAGDFNGLITILMRVLSLKDEVGLDPLKVIEESIGNEIRLFIFDNCESILQDACRIIQSLLHNCRNIKIIATSRQRLGMLGETILNIGFLRYPDNSNSATADILSYESAQLFINRAKSLDPNLSFTDDDLITIGKICAKLDGLPLAIILAASRIKIFSVNDLFKKLDRRFTFLSDIKDVISEKHKTLRQTIAWSYDLLSDEEKIILGILNSLPTSVSMDAICYVLDAMTLELDYYSILQDLEDKSQIIVYESNGRKRFKIPETIREFIASEKQSSMNVELTMGIFSKWIIVWLEAKQIECLGKTDSCIEVFELEIDNVNYVLDYLQKVNDDGVLFKIINLMYQYWVFRGMPTEGLSRLKYINQSNIIDNQDKVHIKMMNSDMLMMKGSYNEAESFMLSIERDSLSDSQQKNYLNSFGNLYYSQGNYKIAKKYFQDYIELIDKGNEKELFKIYKTLAMIASMDGDFPKAIQYLNNIIDECKTMNNNQKAYVYGNIGYYYGELDNYQKAKEYHNKAMELFEQISNKTGLVSSLFNLGNIELYLGNFDQVECYSNKCIEIANEIDDKDTIISAAQNLAVLDLKRGNLINAEKRLLKCLEGNRLIGNIRREAYLYKYLGDVFLKRKEIESAISFYLPSIKVFAENKSINEAFFVVLDFLESDVDEDCSKIREVLKLVFSQFRDNLQDQYREKINDVESATLNKTTELIENINPKYKNYIHEISNALIKN